MNARLGAAAGAALVAAVVAACGGNDPAYEAEVRRTSYGLVHVKANDYRGLGYGYGHAVAQDQLCLIADRVRTLRGERSARFGAEGDALVGFLTLPNLASDLFYRVHLSDAEVDAAWQGLSTNARDLAEGFAVGFNRYLHKMPAAARAAACGGSEPQEMAASDVVRATMQVNSLWKAFIVAPFGPTSRWDDLASTVPQAVAPAPGPQGASNAWAFGGDVTTSGSTIFVANPHTLWQGHWLLMHQMHLTIPGEIDVFGADFAGIPLPLSGFNRDVAWSILAPSTITYPLTLAVELQGGAAPAIVLDGTARPLERRRVEVPVRQADGSVQTQAFELPWSALGPLYRLPAEPGRAAGWYAVADPSVANARALDQMLAAAKARTTAEFSAAVSAHRGITAHFVAGDRHGDALFIEAGPLLDASDAEVAACGVGAAGSGLPAVYDGTRSACTWRDADGRPRLADAGSLPALATRGVAHNENGNYTHAIHGERHDTYSLLLGDPLAAPNPRTLMAQRQIADELANGGRIDPAEALRLVFANRNYAAETLLDDIVAVCRAASPEADVSAACELLDGWDRRMDPASRGALFFHELWSRIGALSGLHAQPYDAAQPFAVRTLSSDPAVAAQVVSAIRETAAALQSLGLTGGEAWESVLAHTTAQGERVGLHGGSGAQGVLNVIETGPLGPDGYQGVVNGTATLFVVTWEGERLVPRMLVANGMSGDPASPHRDDQVGLLAAKQLFQPPFSEDEIRADPQLETRALRE